MNANTGKKKSLPVYHKLLLGCFCCKASGRYISLLTREMAQRYLTQGPREECWQIYELSVAQGWEAPTIFRTAQVSGRYHAEMKRSCYRTWQWECLRKEGFDDTPVQPPDAMLQSSISASYPVRSQLDVEAVAGVTHYSSAD